MILKKISVVIITVLVLSLLIFPALFPAHSQTWKDPVTGMEFIRIPQGNQGIWMGKYEVTNAQYRKYKPKHNSGMYRKYSLDKNQQPVVQVNWDEANEFAGWLTRQHRNRYIFRLPTDAEWEYACCGGTHTMRFWGDNPDDACTYANVYDQNTKKILRFEWKHHNCRDKYPVTAPVGKFAPNPFGLHDMLGNVWEWCKDLYDKNLPPDVLTNPLYYGTLSRVARGGGWSDDPASVRCNLRDGYSSIFRSAYLGFRLVRMGE